MTWVFPLHNDMHPGMRESRLESLARRVKTVRFVFARCNAPEGWPQELPAGVPKYLDDMRISNGIQVSFSLVSYGALNPMLPGISDS